MTDDIEIDLDGAAASGTDDLRDDLVAALSQHAEPASDEQRPATTAAERARDDAGRFAPKAADKAAQGTKEPVAPAAQPETSAQDATRTAPQSWAPDVKNQWATLPPAIQEQILKRERDIETGLRQSADKARVASEFEAAITPHREMIARTGATPAQTFQMLLNAQAILERNPVEGLARIASSYGINLPGLPQQPPLQRPQAAPQIDVHSLVRQEVQQHAEQQRASGEIAAFSSSPDHPHFEAVKPAMIAMLRSGQATTLQDAYDRAVWADPTIRNTLLAERAAPAAVQAQRAANQAAAERARNAAVSVKGAPSGRAASPRSSKGSIEDDVREAINQWA